MGDRIKVDPREGRYISQSLMAADGVVVHDATSRVVTPAELEGFFVDSAFAALARTCTWNPARQRLCRARGAELRGRVVGFITAISYGVLSAFIPLLEGFRSTRGKGPAASSSAGC